jgi:lipopolysaccharide biosynthesis glycosyltransferase
MNNQIHLVLTSDNNYAQHLGVAMVSVLKNSPQADKLVFHIIENGISQENKEKILSLKDKYKTNINIYNLDNSKLKDCPTINHLNQAAYLRLFIPEILPKDIEKVIYLDSDIICLGNLEELYNQNLNNRPLGAIKDIYENRAIKQFFYRGLKSYFNSGIILIDLNKWRKSEVTKKTLNLIFKYKKKLKYADQDILNYLFKNNWQLLDNKFNYQFLDKKDFSIKKDKIPKNTIVLHYISNKKPWTYMYLSNTKKYYLKYLKISPWSNYKYPDKNWKNILRKQEKKLKDILRPLIPLSVLKFKRKYFQNKYAKST